MQEIIIDTCKALEFTVPAGRLTLNLNNTSKNFIFLATYQFELTVNTLSAKWLYSRIIEAKYLSVIKFKKIEKMPVAIF